jgi:hypothetical protein
MPITVYRIDERLLHGQVVVGWGRRLGIGFYAVVDDGIAGTAWERDLYGSALPAGVEPFFLTVEDAIGQLPELEDRGDVDCTRRRGVRGFWITCSPPVTSSRTSVCWATSPARSPRVTCPGHHGSVCDAC